MLVYVHPEVGEVGRHAGLCTPYLPTMVYTPPGYIHPLHTLGIPPYTPVLTLCAASRRCYTGSAGREPWAQRGEKPWVRTLSQPKVDKCVRFGMHPRAGSLLLSG